MSEAGFYLARAASRECPTKLAAWLEYAFVFPGVAAEKIVLGMILLERRQPFRTFGPAPMSTETFGPC